MISPCIRVYFEEIWNSKLHTRHSSKEALPLKIAVVQQSGHVYSNTRWSGGSSVECELLEWNDLSRLQLRADVILEVESVPINNDQWMIRCVVLIHEWLHGPFSLSLRQSHLCDHLEPHFFPFLNRVVHSEQKSCFSQVYDTSRLHSVRIVATSKNLWCP